MQSISIVFLLIDLYKEPVEKSSLHFRDLMYSLKSNVIIIIGALYSTPIHLFLMTIEINHPMLLQTEYYQNTSY